MAQDSNANRVLRLIEPNDYTVSTEADSFAATHILTGETIIVRGNDMLTMVA
jgi:hypothetical protein